MKMLALSLLFATAVNLLIDGRKTLEAAKTLPPQAWWLLIVLAIVCTVIGYTVWFIVIRECPVNVAALTIFAQSVFGIIATLWLGEASLGPAFGHSTIVIGLVPRAALPGESTSIPRLVTTATLPPQNRTAA
jgi:drug/metabolite transporter (DMT)-like permease